MQTFKVFSWSERLGSETLRQKWTNQTEFLHELLVLFSAIPTVKELSECFATIHGAGNSASASFFSSYRPDSNIIPETFIWRDSVSLKHSATLQSVNRFTVLIQFTSKFSWNVVYIMMNDINNCLTGGFLYSGFGVSIVSEGMYLAGRLPGIRYRLFPAGPVETSTG